MKKPPGASNLNASFLLTEVDLALTFLDAAGVTKYQTTRDRNCTKAKAVVQTVVQLLGTMTLDSSDRAEVEARLAVLNERLSASSLRSDD